MGPLRAGLAFALLATLLAAGCLEPGGLRQAPDARAMPEGVYTLTVHVTSEPGGPPLTGVDVEAYWDVPDSREYAGASDIETAQAALSVGRDLPTPRGHYAQRGVSDADGHVVLELPADHRVGIEIAAADHTWEWIPAARTGPADGTGTLTVPLYHTSIEYSIIETWEGTAVTTDRLGQGDVEWQPKPVQWGTNEEARAGYVDRAVYTIVALNWENTPGAQGDLAIVFGEGSGQYVYLWDEHEGQYSLGPHEEWVAGTRWDLQQHGLDRLRDPHIGAGTRELVLAPLGLEYNLTVYAEFDPHPPKAVYTPGPGGIGIALAAALLALFIGRRGRCS